MNTNYRSSLTIAIKGKSLVIKLKGLRDKPLDLDIWGAKRKKDLLEKTQALALAPIRRRNKGKKK